MKKARFAGKASRRMTRVAIPDTPESKVRSRRSNVNVDVRDTQVTSNNQAHECHCRCHCDDDRYAHHDGRMGDIAPQSYEDWIRSMERQ